MKRKSTLFLFSITSVLVGCSNLSRNNTVRSFIPGIYVRMITNEFSTGSDTLLISELSKAGNNYRIVHKTSFQRMAEGKLSKVEKKQEIWNAVYNDQEKLLHETVKGKLLSFNPESRLLYVGTSEYKKISE